MYCAKIRVLFLCILSHIYLIQKWFCLWFRVWEHLEKSDLLAFPCNPYRRVTALSTLQSQGMEKEIQGNWFVAKLRWPKIAHVFPNPAHWPQLGHVAAWLQGRLGYVTPKWVACCSAWSQTVGVGILELIGRVESSLAAGHTAQTLPHLPSVTFPDNDHVHAKQNYYKWQLYSYK